MVENTVQTSRSNSNQGNKDFSEKGSDSGIFTPPITTSFTINNGTDNEFDRIVTSASLSETSHPHLVLDESANKESIKGSSNDNILSLSVINNNNSNNNKINNSDSSKTTRIAFSSANFSNAATASDIPENKQPPEQPQQQGSNSSGRGRGSVDEY